MIKYINAGADLKTVQSGATAHLYTGALPVKIVAADSIAGIVAFCERNLSVLERDGFVAIK